MGHKGDKMKQESIISAELMLEKLTPIGGITIKKMFGGHGVFHEGKMFGIIDPKGNAFLKADATLISELESKGSEKHGKMRYYSIPDVVFNNFDMLLAWAKQSIEISK